MLIEAPWHYRHPPRVSATIAEQLAQSYALMAEMRSTQPTVPFAFDIPAFSLQDIQAHPDRDYLAPFGEIYRIVNDEPAAFVDGFYLYGSFATMDYVKGWSDVHTFAVLSRETSLSKERLLAVRDIFRKPVPLMNAIDSLQHHGVIVITAMDLSSYPATILPVKVFEFMRSLAK